MGRVSLVVSSHRRPSDLGAQGRWEAPSCPVAIGCALLFCLQPLPSARRGLKHCARTRTLSHARTRCGQTVCDAAGAQSPPRPWRTLLSQCVTIDYVFRVLWNARCYCQLSCTLLCQEADRAGKAGRRESPLLLNRITAEHGAMAEKRMSRWYFGGLASCGAACCTHPLDLLKVRGLKCARNPPLLRRGVQARTPGYSCLQQGLFTS